MDSSSTSRVSYFLDTLWYAGSATETLMVLLALLAITVGAGGVFPQQPPGLDGAGSESWLAATAGNYPGAGQLLRQIGAFTIFESPWLRVLLAALAFAVALRLAIQISALAHPLRADRDTSSNSESAVRNPQSATSPTVGPLLAYAGTLILLAGLFANSIAGWRTAELALAPGDSVPLRQRAGQWLSLDELTGSADDPIAHLGFTSVDREQPTSTGLASAGRPARWSNLWIALRSAGPVLRATARDDRGRALLLQSLEPGSAGGLRQGQAREEIHLLFRQGQAEQEFALPSADLSFRVVSYPSLPDKGIEDPVFLVEAYRGADPAPLFSDFVVDKATLVVDGASLDLKRDRYAIVQAASEPGLVPMLLGGLMLLTGVILALGRVFPAMPRMAGGSAGAAADAEPAHAP